MRNQLSSDTTPLEHFQSVFLSQWKELLSLRKKILKKPSINAIHDFRITLRRLRLSIKIFEYFTSSRAKKKFKKTLKRLTKTLGNIRNIDEAMLFFQSPTHSINSHHFCSHLATMRSLEVKKITNQLATLDHHFDHLINTMLEQLEAIKFTKTNMRALLQYFANSSDYYYKTIHVLLAVSTLPGQRKSRHALRIAIKKWRYFLEMVGIILDRDYDLLIKLLKKYQSILGQLNDVVAFGALTKDIRLSPSERRFAKQCLVKEEKILLKKLISLIKQKPLLKSEFKIRITAQSH